MASEQQGDALDRGLRGLPRLRRDHADCTGGAARRRARGCDERPVGPPTGATPKKPMQERPTHEQPQEAEQLDAYVGQPSGWEPNTALMESDDFFTAERRNMAEDTRPVGVQRAAAGAPIEFVGLAVQTQDENPKARSEEVPRRKGIADCGMRNYEEQGAKRPWDGNLTRCTRYLLAWALDLAFVNTFKTISPKYNPKTDFDQLFGASRALDASPVTRSGEVPRHKGAGGAGDCCTHSYGEQGMKHSRDGSFINCIRHIPAQAFNLAFKDTFKEMAPKYDPKTEFAQDLRVEVAQLRGATEGVLAVSQGGDGFRSAKGDGPPSGEGEPAPGRHRGPAGRREDVGGWSPGRARASQTRPP